MTTYVNFNVDPESAKLKIQIENESENELETIFAKKVLSIASRLAFADIQQVGVFDVGARIVIEAFGQETIDEENLNEFSNKVESNIVKAGVFKLSPDGKKAIPVNASKKQDEPLLEKEETLDDVKWKVGADDSEVSLSLDISDANQVIGALASTSVTSAMAVFVLVKKTIHMVEDHFGLEHQEYSSTLDDNYDDDSYYDEEYAEEDEEDVYY